MSIYSRYCEVATDLCNTTVKDLNRYNQVFSAYSSHNPEIVSQIESAIKELNKSSGIRWVSWKKDMEIENALIFCEICKHISQSKAILVELSDLNFNVVFEYGFSLGLGKKIHPIVSTGFDFKNVERFIHPLLGVGLGTYEKNKLAKKLEKKKFWEKALPRSVYDFEEHHILNDDYKIEANSILYIKNIDDSRVSDEIEKELFKSPVNIIVDDAHEENYNIIWYSKQIKRSFGAIIDLGMSSKTDNMKHFLKCAFISGICVATGRRTLILSSVHSPKPSDIIALIKQYESPKSAGRKVYAFIDKNANILSMINSYITTLHKDRQTVFDKIDLGEHVAINDKYFIEKCFVEIPEYANLNKKGYKLIIGRKGTGKSAAFFHFKTGITKSNEIIVHQLFDKYNLNDLYGITESFEGLDNKNKIASAFWTYVLLLIVAKHIRKSIDSEPAVINPKEIQLNEHFIKYFDTSEFNILDKSITEDLVELLNRIKAKGAKTVKEVQKAFYSTAIIELKSEVCKYVVNSGKTLYLNIDGLDANLDIQKNKNIISLILFNLHEVCSNLFSQLVDKYSINLFLRTDLYLAFKDEITEKDKISKLFFSWQPEYLIQIINYRLQENNINHIADLLHEDFSMDKLMQKITKLVYSRPRDYVYLFNNLVQIAKSLKKDKIDNKVFNEALEYYALHVNESFEAEFLSLRYEINYGLFLTNLKELLKGNDDGRLRVKKFLQLLKDMSFEENKIAPFLLFLLQIKFIELRQDEEPIEWNKLSNPKIKLDKILEESHNRYFYFSSIIQKIINDLF